MAEKKGVASPSEWIMRVRSFKEKKDFKAAIAECGKGLKQFPKSIDLLFTYGELRVGLYNIEKKPDHLKTALISFEKLLHVNPHHYMANSISAQIYYKGKVWKRAHARAEEVLKTSPRDPKALKIKMAADKAMQKAGDTAKKSDQAALPPEKPKPDMVIDETQDIRTEKIDGLQSAQSSDYENIINKLSYFSKLDDVVSLHLIDPSGVDIKSIWKGGKASEKVSSLVADIFRNSGLCTTKMGIGNFQRGQVLTGEGYIIIVNVFYAILAIVGGPQADLHEIDKRISRYIEDLV